MLQKYIWQECSLPMIFFRTDDAARVHNSRQPPARTRAGRVPAPLRVAAPLPAVPPGRLRFRAPPADRHGSARGARRGARPGGSAGRRRPRRGGVPRHQAFRHGGVPASALHPAGLARCAGAERGKPHLPPGQTVQQKHELDAAPAARRGEKPPRASAAGQQLLEQLAVPRGSGQLGQAGLLGRARAVPEEIRRLRGLRHRQVFHAQGTGHRAGQHAHRHPARHHPQSCPCRPCGLSR